ncbi:MAG: LysM domain-containing protein, partial [Myxococcota bacterium]
MSAEDVPTETYVVRAGDWLAKIAEEHDSTVSAIWNHMANAPLRSQRGSPDVLYPGDVLHIPREPAITPPPQATMPPPDVAPPWPYEHEKSWIQSPTWACPSETCQCERHAEVRYEHTITFHDLDGHRLPNARCRVYENGKLITPKPTQTDGAGRLTVTLRASSTSLFLEWAPPDVPPARGLPYRK